MSPQVLIFWFAPEDRAERSPCYLAGFQWPGDWRGYIEEEDDGAISSEESTGTPSSGIPNAMTWLDGWSLN